MSTSPSHMDAIQRAVDELRPFYEQLREQYLVPAKPPLPKTRVYHYTSGQALQAIVQSRRIHATCLTHANDRSELSHGITILKREIAYLSKVDTSQHMSKFLTTLREAASDVTARACFAFSASCDRDELSQWRCYADEGRGYAIGFDWEDLASLEDHQFNVSHDFILYDQPAQRDFVRAWLTRVSQRAVQGMSTDGLSADQLAGIFATHFCWLAALFLKHPAFYAEKEARVGAYYGTTVFDYLLNSLGTGYAPNKTRRLEGDQLVPYRELHFPGLSMPIREVVVGPRLSFRRAQESVKHIFDKAGLALPDIRPSIAPYRG